MPPNNTLTPASLPELRDADTSLHCGVHDPICNLDVKYSARNDRIFLSCATAPKTVGEQLRSKQAAKRSIRPMNTSRGQWVVNGATVQPQPLI